MWEKLRWKFGDGNLNRTFAAFLALAAVLWTAYSIASSLELYRSKFWPTTRGKILTSSVKHDRDYVTENNVRKMKDRYRPVVGYRYEVDGRTYEGDRLAFDVVDTPVQNYARDDIAPFRIGATVNVSYDPSDPTRAVLKPGFTTVRGMVWHGFCYGVAPVLLVFAWILWRAPPEKPIDGQVIASMLPAKNASDRQESGDEAARVDSNER